MKYITLLIIFALTCFGAWAQKADNAPNDLTPQKVEAIKANIEQQVVTFKQKHAKSSPQALEFMVDTFRIQRLFNKVMDVDYSTAGMANATGMRTNEYDKLLNKYYGKLLKRLKPEDKKALTDAQRSWITFRDNERKLINTLSKEVYSGGGTIQIITTASEYSQLVEKRAIALAQYCLSLDSQDK